MWKNITTGHKCISFANGCFKLLNEYHFELDRKKVHRSSHEPCLLRILNRHTIRNGDAYHLCIIAKVKKTIL